MRLFYPLRQQFIPIFGGGQIPYVVKPVLPTFLIFVMIFRVFLRSPTLGLLGLNENLPFISNKV